MSIMDWRLKWPVNCSCGLPVGPLPNRSNGSSRISRENKALVAEFERRKVAKLLDEPLFPEVKQLLVDLAAMGYINVISSSNVPDMIEKYVAKHDLKIEKVLGFRAPDFYKGKPHFDFLKAHYGVSNEEILFLGDSPEDYEHSALNSVPFIGRTGTFSREILAKVGIKHIVDDLSEIKSMIERFSST